MAALQLYRQSAVGDTLSDALHELVAEDKISGALATKVMAEVLLSCVCVIHIVSPDGCGHGTWATNCTASQHALQFAAHC